MTVSQIFVQLQVSQSIALRLLIQCEWDESKLLESPEEARVAIGISDTDFTLSRCRLCTEEEMNANDVELQQNPACGHGCGNHLNQWLTHQVNDDEMVLKCVTEDCSVQHGYGLLLDPVTHYRVECSSQRTSFENCLNLWEQLNIPQLDLFEKTSICGNSWIHIIPI